MKVTTENIIMVRKGLPWDDAWLWLIEGMGIVESQIPRIWLCPCGMLWLRPVKYGPPKYVKR